MPVMETTPRVVASPYREVAASNSPSVSPASATARPRSGSTEIRFIEDMSSISPSSHTAFPATEWPPPLTDSGRSYSRATVTPQATSSAQEHLRIAAGRRSIIALNTRRDSS